MIHRDFYLNFKHQPAVSSGPRDRSPATLRYGSLLLATFAAVHIFPIAGASAAEPNTDASRLVSFGDLDLDRVSDRRILRSRVNNAARTVCQQLTDDLIQRDWCVYSANRQAAPQLRQAIASAKQRQSVAAAKQRQVVVATSD